LQFGIFKIDLNFEKLLWLNVVTSIIKCTLKVSELQLLINRFKIYGMCYTKIICQIVTTTPCETQGKIDRFVSRSKSLKQYYVNYKRNAMFNANIVLY
jgi:hypothetical protein